MCTCTQLQQTAYTVVLDMWSYLIEFTCFSRTEQRVSQYNYRVRSRLYQASASTQSQCSGDACNIALIDIRGVAPEWVVTPF